jgi:hypothetical protein
MYCMFNNCNHNAKYTSYVRLFCCHSHVCFRPATAKTVAPRSGCSSTALYLRRWRTGGVRRRTRSTCRAGRWPPRCRTCRTCSSFPLRGEVVDSVAVPCTWRVELQERFALVNPPNFLAVPDALGPAKCWVIQYRVHTIIFN